MPIEHKDIPDGQRHEPKGISSALNKTVYKADGVGAGAWQRLTEVDLDYSNKANNVFGWVDIADNQYTSGAPRSINSGVRTKLTNNAAGAQTDVSRLPGIWDVANNRFLINDLNAAYGIRVQFLVKAAAAAGTPYTLKLELQSANGPTVITNLDHAIKGGSYENGISYTTFIYNGPFINNQPLELYVTPDTNITLYNIGITVQRTYKET